MGVPSDLAQPWGQARDLVGYGRRGPDVRWPDDERASVCRLWQLVTQRPVGSLACNFGPAYTVGLGEEVAQWVIGYQSDDLGALFPGKVQPPAGAGTVAEPSISSRLNRWGRSLAVRRCHSRTP
jgi:hypothetical protein